MSFLLGHLARFTKYVSLHCMTDSRDQMCNDKTRKWTALEELVPHRTRKPIKELLFDSDRMQAPPLHIEIGLMMQLTNFVDKGGNHSLYL